MRYNEIITELTGYKDKEETKFVKDELGRLSWDMDDRLAVFDQFKDQLKERGFTPLGNGMFGTVFTHPSLNYAIKIIKNDPAYMVFVRYALANQSNPFLPKFRGKFMSLGGSFYAVRMELLTKIDVTNEAAFTQATVMHILKKYGGFRDLNKFLDDLSTSPIPGMEEAAEAYRRDPNDLVTMNELMNLAKATGIEMDVKVANFMLRGNRIVVTDPFWTEDAFD